MTLRRVGILGGTFDPFHCGHLDVARAAESTLGLTEVVVMTANVPPHRPQPFASSHHRFAMVAMAIAGRDRWRASDIELGGSGPSFTTDTLRRFHDAGFQPADLFFILGADAFAEIESWRDFPGILDRAHFTVVSRPGFPAGDMPARFPALSSRMQAPSKAMAAAPSIFLIDAATADVSGTAIRQRAAAGQSIAGLVPPAVRQHIEQHALYSPSNSGDPGSAGAENDRGPWAGRLHGQD